MSGVTLAKIFYVGDERGGSKRLMSGGENDDEAKPNRKNFSLFFDKIMTLK